MHWPASFTLTSSLVGHTSPPLEFESPIIVIDIHTAPRRTAGLDCNAVREYRYEQYVKHFPVPFGPPWPLFHPELHTAQLYSCMSYCWYYYFLLCTFAGHSGPSASLQRRSDGCIPATRHFQLRFGGAFRAAVPSSRTSAPCLRRTRCWVKGAGTLDWQTVETLR